MTATIIDLRPRFAPPIITRIPGFLRFSHIGGREVAEAQWYSLELAGSAGSLFRTDAGRTYVGRDADDPEGKTVEHRDQIAIRFMDGGLDLVEPERILKPGVHDRSLIARLFARFRKAARAA